ncbi:MAG: AAA family ATPase [Planctomycetales bacterium]|nr:AAA family ATPase [Planctomycetales bacterium]
MSREARLMRMSDTAWSERVSASPSTGLLQALLNPSFYPDAPGHVELIETHISWVFLTDRFAYKLKKPVHFDFLDFSTLDLRRRDCQQEIEVNRRFTHRVYLAMVPITRGPEGGYQLAGPGEPVDWLVKMRRLPERRCLRTLIRSSHFDAHTQTVLAETLALLYVGLAPVTIRAADYEQRLRAHIRSNGETLLSCAVASPERLATLHAAQQRFVWLRSPALKTRVCDGRIIDGHGDLRPEHIYLLQPMQIIDAIEFNPEYRANDIVDELAFLAMECRILGANEFGSQLFDAYMRRSQDIIPAGLIDFYTSYRAAVRAKVLALQSRQNGSPLDATPVERYLRLADEAATSFRRPVLLAMHGFSGSGKTTLASAIGKCLGAEVLQTDWIRKQGRPAPAAPSPYGSGAYTTANRHQIYRELFALAEHRLQSNPTVIMDGTFLTADIRSQAEEFARRQGAELLFISCECPASVAEKRLRSRSEQDHELSDANTAIRRKQVADAAPLASHEAVAFVDTTDEMEVQLETVRRRVLELACAP